MMQAGWLIRAIPRRNSHFSVLGAALCLATFASFELPWRYQLISPVAWTSEPADRSRNTEQSNGRNAGEYRRDLAIRLTAANGIEIPAARVYLPKPGEDGFVRIVAEVMGQNIVAGAETWQVGQVSVLSYDLQGNPLLFWPRKLVTLTDNSDWRTHELVVPIADTVRELRLVAYNAAASGTLGVRGVAIDLLDERPFFSVIHRGLMIAWTVLGAWVFAAMISAPARPVLKSITTTIALAVIASAVIPQPEYSRLIGPIEGWLSALSQSVLLGDISTPPESAVDTVQQLSPSDAMSDSELDRAGGPVTRTSDEVPKFGNWHETIFLATTDSTSLDILPFRFEELAHFSGFALLAALALLTYRAVSFMVIGEFLALSAPTTECLQLFLVTRSFEWWDLAVDSAGIATGVLAVIGWLVIRRAMGATARLATWS